MAQHCKHPPLLFCVVLHLGALHHMHKKATHSWTLFVLMYSTNPLHSWFLQE